MNWKPQALQLWLAGKSWTEIYAAFPDIDNEQIRGYIRFTKEYKNKQKKIFADQPVGVIGDLHQPFTHPNYLQFCQDTFERYGVGRVVSVGDILDNYCYSRFNKKPIAWTPLQERELAITGLQNWYKAFPKLDIVWGNHDLRLITACEDAGIDPAVLRDIRKQYEMPKGWTFYDENEDLLIINDVLYLHGTAYGGENGCKLASVNEQMSVVMGHSHTSARYVLVANKRKLMFGMNVGCGIDNTAYSFAYNKKDKTKPIISCGIVYDSGFAILVPMGAEYFRN